MTPSNSEQVKPAPRVSVVVVSHNRVELLRRCLASVERSEARDTLQAIVVENGSTDGSAHLEAEFPNVQWVRLPKNFGLTKAWNLGWRAADAEFVFYLHDDTEVAPETIGRLADVLAATQEAVAVCPLLVDAKGQPAPQLGGFPPDGEWRAAEPGTEPIAVEYPRGAALMVRVFYIKAMRQIDERFGQFGADADVAMQIKRASRKILLVPDAKVTHYARETYTTAEQADLTLARAAFVGKYQGFAAGLQARIGSMFGALFGLRLGEFKFLLSGQKIDGTY